jgi:DNA-binding cell septation regulator SpoVG
MTVSNWKSFEKGMLRGFFRLTLPSGLIINDCMLHAKGAARWIGLPAQRSTGKDGKDCFKPVLEFTDRTVADKLRDQVLKPLDGNRP